MSGQKKRLYPVTFRNRRNCSIELVNKFIWSNCPSPNLAKKKTERVKLPFSVCPIPRPQRLPFFPLLKGRWCLSKGETIKTTDYRKILSAVFIFVIRLGFESVQSIDRMTVPRSDVSIDLVLELVVPTRSPCIMSVFLHLSLLLFRNVKANTNNPETADNDRR